MKSRFLLKLTATRRGVVSGPGAVLASALLSLTPAALATEPQTPIEIVTPEEVMQSGKFVTDQVDVLFQEKQLSGFKPQLILFQNGKQITQLGIDLRPEPVKGDREDASGKGYSRARIDAVPAEFRTGVEPGVYAHKIRIEANLKDEAGSLIEEEWVRWRTDGRRVELLDIERYSALVEKTSITTDASGKPLVVLTGLDVKLDTPGEVTMEKPDARIGSDGVHPEQAVKLNKEELERSLDESNEE